MNRHRALILGAALALALAGCGKLQGPLAMQAAAAHPAWQEIATDNDRGRLRGWRESWATALDDARAGGDAVALKDNKLLFDPDQALADPTPPPGDYRCRWFKLGSNGPAVAAYTVYPAGRCRISQAGKTLRLVKLDGPQRPQGLIFDDEPSRDVFLGTLMLDDETAPLDYGQDETRDMAGYVERIGKARWRLALPAPHFESVLDVIELTPE